MIEEPQIPEEEALAEEAPAEEAVAEEAPPAGESATKPDKIDADAPEAPSEVEADEQEPMPIGDVLEELAEAGLDPEVVEDLQQKIAAEGGSTLTEEEVDAIRTMNELRKEKQAELEAIDAEIGAKVDSVVNDKELRETDLETWEKSVAEALNEAYGEEELEQLALKLLKFKVVAAEWAVAWIFDGFASSDLGRFIDAVIAGAGYNSAGSMRRHEAENDSEVVESSSFFELVRDKPRQVVDGLIENKAELNEAGWKIDGDDLAMLRDSKTSSKTEKEALLEIFVGKNQGGVNSLAKQLNGRVDHVVFWGRVSPILAKVFDKDKKMLAFEIKELLQKFGTQKEDPTKGAYFGQVG
jgi:hypothetical protein